MYTDIHLVPRHTSAGFSAWYEHTWMTCTRTAFCIALAGPVGCANIGRDTVVLTTRNRRDQNSWTISLWDPCHALRTVKTNALSPERVRGRFFLGISWSRSCAGIWSMNCHYFAIGSTPRGRTWGSLAARRTKFTFAARRRMPSRAWNREQNGRVDLRVRNRKLRCEASAARQSRFTFASSKVENIFRSSPCAARRDSVASDPCVATTIMPRARCASPPRSRDFPFQLSMNNSED
jgi:hypothetical protein